MVFLLEPRCLRKHNEEGVRDKLQLLVVLRFRSYAQTLHANTVVLSVHRNPMSELSYSL